MRAALEFTKRFRSAQRMHVRCANESPRIIALGFLGFVVDESRPLDVRAHSCAAGQHGHVDSGEIHHANVLVEIEQQRMRYIAGRAVFVVGKNAAVARVLLEKFARCEVVLKVDDQSFFSGTTAGQRHFTLPPEFFPHRTILLRFDTRHSR